MMSNRERGTIYVGVTSDLARRIYHHKTDKGSGFVAKYRCQRLVWFQRFDDIETAIIHEKRIKRWRRAWKFDLIEQDNPEWEDLFASLNR